MNLRLYTRRVRYWYRSICGSVGSAGRSGGGLLSDIYSAYFAGIGRTTQSVVSSASTGGWRKRWGRWMVALGFRRRLVQRRKKRSAQHLASLESELEDLKSQLALMESLLNPVPQAPSSSQGCPTTISPAHAQETAGRSLPADSAASADAVPQRVFRPPPPPRRRAPGARGAGSGTSTSTSDKIRLRPVRMPPHAYSEEMGIQA